MPRIKYKDYKPRGETPGVIETADDILCEYNDQGFNLTLRQLYYQFVARDLFPDAWVDPQTGSKNHDGNYNRLKSIIARAREAGMIDWNHIKDRGRKLENRPHWQSGEQFLRSVAPQFHIDLWEDQPIMVEVWVEKDALSDVIDQACHPYDVPNFACKGYASASSMWEAAHDRMLLRYAQRDQEVVIVHLGDHDPSGVHMTEDIQNRLDLFSTPYQRESGWPRPDITVKRIALNMDQIQQYDPPPNPTKEADPRSDDYIAQYGETCWELDALDPSTIVQLVRNAIEEHLERDLFDARKEYKYTERRRLMAMAANWEEMVEALPEDAEDDVEIEEEDA